MAATLLALAPWLWALPERTLTVAAAVAVMVGIPHGALDYHVARAIPGWGRTSWSTPRRFTVFALPYLGLVGLVLGLWVVAPVAALAIFLVLSIAHFGLEDTDGGDEPPGWRAVAVLARGGLPVALPILLHPGETDRFFALLTGVDGLASAWRPLAVVWLVSALLAVARVAWRGVRRRPVAWIEPVALVLVFAALPPLAAFAFYFLAVHSARHGAELAARHAPDDARRGWAWAVSRSLPLTLATAALGLALFWALAGDPETRLVRTVFWGVAGLTAPHMALVWLDTRHGGSRLT